MLTCSNRLKGLDADLKAKRDAQYDPKLESEGMNKLGYSNLFKQEDGSNTLLEKDSADLFTM